MHQELGPPTLTFPNVDESTFGNFYKTAGINCGLYIYLRFLRQRYKSLNITGRKQLSQQ